MIDAIHRYNRDDGSFIEEYKKYFNVSDKGEIEFSEDVKLNMNDYTSSKLNTHF